MNATPQEVTNVLNRLRYPLNIAPWDSVAENNASVWFYESLNIEIAEVKRITTPRYPQFRDFDLVARLRANTGALELTGGCQGSIVVDGQFGMHKSNTRWLYDSMWYAATIAVVTVRCHEGHAEDFTSWIVPSNNPQLARMQSRIIAKLGGAGYYGSYACTDEQRRTAFTLLNSKVKYTKRRRR